MNEVKRTIDEILCTYFEVERHRLSGVRLYRLDRVESALRKYLEAEGERVLTADERVLVHAERQFNPGAAFVTTMHAEHLAPAIRGFLAQPWRPDQRLMRTAQLGHIEGLMVMMISNHHLVSLPHEVIMDIRRDLEEGNREVTHLRSATTPRPTRLPGEG